MRKLRDGEMMSLVFWVGLVIVWVMFSPHDSHQFGFFGSLCEDLHSLVVWLVIAYVAFFVGTGSGQ